MSPRLSRFLSKRSDKVTARLSAPNFSSLRSISTAQIRKHPLISFSLLFMIGAGVAAWSGQASSLSRITAFKRITENSASASKTARQQDENNALKSGSNSFFLSGPPPLSSPTPVPPGGVTFNQTGFTDDGTISRSSGKTWYFKNFSIPSSSVVYWGAANNLVRLSFLSNTFSSAGEVVTYQPGQSNLATGLLVWTGQTRLPDNGVTVFTKFIMQVNNHSGSAPGGTVGTPVALLDAACVGLPANVGGVVPVNNGMDFQVNMKFQASYSPGGPFQPALDFYDSQSNAGFTAFSSFDGGFFSTAALNGPVFPPPGSFVFFDTDAGNTGLSGRPGGNTLFFSSIQLASTDIVYWGLDYRSTKGVKLSFDGPAYTTSPGIPEFMNYEPSQSNLTGTRYRCSESEAALHKKVEMLPTFEKTFGK